MRARPALLPAAAVVTLLLAGCGGAAEPAETVTVTAEAPEAPAAETSPAELSAVESETTAPPVTPPAADPVATAPAESAEPEATFTMPAVVGANLQDAQDLLQTFDSYVMDQVDATGLERFAVNDSNWLVCAQDPASGAVVPVSTMVTLSAVKLDETCP